MGEQYRGAINALDIQDWLREFKFKLPDGTNFKDAKGVPKLEGYSKEHEANSDGDHDDGSNGDKTCNSAGDGNSNAGGECKDENSNDGYTTTIIDGEEERQKGEERRINDALD